MSTQSSRIKQPWFIRRVAYLLVGAVLLVAAAFGLLDEGQVDAVTASPILGTLVAWVAATFTHQGSDSPATSADVEQARKDAAPDTAAIVDRVGALLTDALSRIPGAEQVGDAVVSAIRAEEQGEHTTNRSITPTSVADYYRR